jgi:DNA polymerase-3 subunit beta
MKIKIDKVQLVNNLQKVQNVVPSKVTIPILNNIYIKTKIDHLFLFATDLDIGLRCEFPVETVNEGAITIPAKRFYDVIRELPDGEVIITAKKNNQIDIEGQNCRFKLNGLPEEDFPKFPEFDPNQEIILKQKMLREMLSSTVIAVSHEESRYVLNGVLTEIEQDLMRMVSTDGRRLAKIERKLASGSYDSLNFIIPLKAIHELLRNLTSDEDDVHICVGKNQILFRMNEVIISSRIIDGEFPNYKQVIPDPIDTKIQINAQLLLSAIRRANLLSTPDFQAVKFEIFSDKMIVSKNTPDVGESREELAVVYSGPEIAVGFNPTFLIDFLKLVHTETIDVELLGVDKPAVIRLDDYLYLALPMRI